MDTYLPNVIGRVNCAYPAVAYIMWLLLLNMVTLALELSVVTYAT